MGYPIEQRRLHIAIENGCIGEAIAIRLLAQASDQHVRVLDIPVRDKQAAMPITETIRCFHHTQPIVCGLLACCQLLQEDDIGRDVGIGQR